jgi:hypothetical protein
MTTRQLQKYILTGLMFTDKRKMRYNRSLALGGVLCSADSFVVTAFLYSL